MTRPGIDMDDKKTLAYFDNNVPEYAAGRLNYAAQKIKELCGPKSSLLDVGCGTGNILEYLKKQTPLTEICGADISDKYLQQAKQRIGCEVFSGSICQDDFCDRIGKKFDFVLLSAVLHHLIGTSRKQSREMAGTAISNSIKLLKPHGHLIVLEPVFYPSFVMDIVFHLKKFVTSLTSQRIPIGGKWNNIGAPVVSYYTNEELKKMIEYTKSCSIIAMDIKEGKVPFICRMAMITRRTETTIIVKKTTV